MSPDRAGSSVLFPLFLLRDLPPRPFVLSTGNNIKSVRSPLVKVPSKPQSAETILVTAAIRDVSVCKDAEKHLAQIENGYRGLLAAAPDAMGVGNSGGQSVLLNVQAEIQVGYHRDELVGQKNLIPEGFAKRALADGTDCIRLSYLRNFRFDTLTIDQSFGREITTAWNDTTIVMAVISRATRLKLWLVAQGVETQGQAGK